MLSYSDFYLILVLSRIILFRFIVYDRNLTSIEIDVYLKLIFNPSKQIFTWIQRHILKFVFIFCKTTLCLTRSTSNLLLLQRFSSIYCILGITISSDQSIKQLIQIWFDPCWINVKLEVGPEISFCLRPLPTNQFILVQVRLPSNSSKCIRPTVRVFVDLDFQTEILQPTIYIQFNS